MASIVRLGSDKRPLWALDFIDTADRKRKRLRLGRCGAEMVREFKHRIERLLEARALNQASPETAAVACLRAGNDLLPAGAARACAGAAGIANGRWVS